MIYDMHPCRPLGRFFYVLISVLLAAGLAHAQGTVSVSGNVRDLAGAPALKTKVRIHLANCSGIPRVIGSGIVARDSYELTPNASGTFSGAVYPNPSITCSGGATSTYKVMIFVDGALRWQEQFLITANTDLNGAAPLANVPPSAPASSYLVLNPAGDQIVSQPQGSAMVVSGGFGLRAQRINNIRMADQFPGTDAGARIIAAIADLPATGGTVDARGFEGTVFLNSTITIAKPVTLLLGAARFDCLADPCFAVNHNLVVRGISRRATSLHSQDNGTIFAGGGTVEVFHLENILFQGYDASAVLLNAPAFQAGVNDWDAARVTIDNCVITGFGGKAIKIGQSVQFFDIRRNLFEFNEGHLDIGWASDGEIAENEIFRGNGTVPQIRVAGGSIVKIVRNVFMKSSGSSIAADIEVNSCNTSGASGFLWIAQNKFGPEGEVAARPKLRTFCSTSTSDYSRNVYVVDNFFGGNGTSYAIQLDNPIDRWMIAGNFFSGYTTALVNDAFTPPNVNIGASVFTRTNRVLPIGATGATAMPREFANGGRGFLIIEPITLGLQDAADITPRVNETAGLRNRIAFSEDLSNAAWSKTGVSVTAAQPDPFGGSRAVLLTRTGGATGERAQINIDTTTDSPRRLVVKLWAKAGTLQQLQPTVRDTTNGRIIHHAPLLTLDSTWRQFKFVVEGITPGGNPVYALTLYPGNFSQVQAGTVSVFGAQVSDQDSDYLPAAGSAAVNTAGNRFERRVMFANSTPFEIVSGAAKVNNLDADKLDGADWSAPPAIGSATPNSGSFTGITVGSNLSMAAGAAPACAAGDYRMWADSAALKFKKCENGTVTDLDTGGSGGGSGDSLTVNAVAVADADLSNTTPGAPAGGINVRWQKDALTPAHISAHLLTTDLAAATFGSGSPFAWTFDSGAATDPAISFNASDFTLNAPLLLPDGTAAAPGFGFSATPNYGFYKFNSSNIGFTAAGVVRVAYGATTANARGDFIYAWSSGSIGAVDTGLSRSAAGELSVGNGTAASASGSLRATILNALTGVRINGAAPSGQILRGNGTNFTPGDDVRSVTFIAGGDSSSTALADSDDQPTFFRNNLGRTYRITEVWCESDAGTPTINLQRDDGTPADVLTANLSCSTAGATGTIAAAEQDLADGNRLDFMIAAAGGAAKRVTVSIKLVAQ